MNIEILEVEDKIAKNGRKYSRFKTSDGWASAFDSDIIDGLRNNVGKSVSVEMVTDSDKGFKNIRAFHGTAEGDKTLPVIKIKESKTNGSMYVSYCKDLLISGKAKTMEEATEMIKLAKAVFDF